MPRRLTRIILIAMVGALCTVFALPASAAEPSPIPVALTVSTPSDPLPAEPGQVVQTWLRIGNNGTSPLPVTIAPATVELGDNGTTSLSPNMDPRFAGLITLSTTEATVAAGSFTEVQVAISVPTTLVPDTYILGFLVTPTVTGGSVQVLNQVGALIAIDLPGSRDRRLEATFLDPPLFAFTSQPSLTVRVHNIGQSALEFSSETTIGGVAPADPANIRNQPVLLPAGRYRDVEIKWESPLGAGIYQLDTRVVYHRTQAETAQQSLTHTIIVLSPAALAILGILLILIAAAITLGLRHRRRRQRQRTQQGHGRRTHRPNTPAAGNPRVG